MCYKNDDNDINYIFLCDVLGNSTCVLQNALIENIYTENELTVCSHWNNWFITLKTNLSVYSIQGLLKAASKGRIGVERLTTDFFHITFSEHFSVVRFLFVNCLLLAHDFPTHTRKQATTVVFTTASPVPVNKIVKRVNELY